MKDLLQAANRRHQRQGGFDQHAFVPGATRAELEVVWNAVSVIEAGIGQNNALVFQSRGQLLDANRTGRVRAAQLRLGAGESDIETT